MIQPVSRRLPPPQALHAFDAAARHMSFTEAARELHVSQAAISQRIRVLEQQLGQRLFVRHARGLELTEAGRALLPAVSEGFERLATGIAEAFGTRRDEPLTIRTTPAFALHWLAPRLRQFQEQHPGVMLRLTTAIWPGDFDLDGVDLEVRYGRGGWEGVECRRLTRERLAPVCNPAFASELREPEDLAGHVLLHAVGFESGWPQWLAHVAAGDVLERTTPLLCDTAGAVYELAARGAGVALGRSSFLDTLVGEGRLVAPFDAWIETEEAFFVTRAAGREPRPEIELFWSWLTDCSEGAGQD